MKIYRFVDCVFSQPLLPWLHKSGGEGLIKSNGWLLDEINIALNKRTEINMTPLLLCMCKKYPFQRWNLAMLWCQKIQQQQRLPQWYFCCCCSAGRMMHCKMWEEKTEATAAGFQDCPRETKIHRGCCLLLWVELLLPSKQERVFWRTNNATLKARTMPMAPAATLSTERQLAWSEGHHSVQQQRVMVKMLLWCCGGEKGSKAGATMLTWHIA